MTTHHDLVQRGLAAGLDPEAARILAHDADWMAQGSHLTAEQWHQRLLQGADADVPTWPPTWPPPEHDDGPVQLMLIITLIGVVLLIAAGAWLLGQLV